MSRYSCVRMGKRGFFTGFAEPVCGPAYSCFFMPNIKAMSINITNLGGTVNYHDNHKEININGANTNVRDVVKAFMQDEDPSQPDHYETAEEVEGEPVLPLPKEGKYTKVREYIKERSRFDAEFKAFVKERSLRDLCARLTKEFGWYVDEHSLGSNLNRHRKE